MAVPDYFVTFDTESKRYQVTDDKEKQEFFIGDIYDGNKHNFFYDLDQFILRIVEYSKNKKWVYVFAHNIGYDSSLTGLKKMFILGKDFFGFKRHKFMIMDNNFWVRYTKLYSKKREQQNIVFLDSYQFLQKSLGQLAEDILKEHKYAKEEYLYSPKEWNEYISKNGFDLVKVDTEILYKLLEKFFEFLRKYDMPFGYTLSNIAYNEFLKNHLKYRIFFDDNVSPEYYDDMESAYRGGFVNVLELGNIDNIITYDVNSEYPKVMYKHNYPIKFVKMLKDITIEKYLEYSKLYYIISNVDFELPENSISFITKKIGNKLISIRKGNQTLHKPEIDYLIEENAKIKFNRVYLYEQVNDLFDSYVEKFYKIKKEADNPSERYIAKILLNSLYGKFGQNRETTEYIAVDENKEIDKPSRYMIIEGNEKIVITDYGYFKAKKVKHRNKFSYEIAGAVTSYARMYLYHLAKKIGLDSCVYFDTDSIHAKFKVWDGYGDLKDLINAVSYHPEFQDVIGNELGQLKIEKRGYGEYYAPKCYRFNGDWTFKGVNILKDKQLSENVWLHSQFSKIKSVIHKGVQVMKVKKSITFKNDKFKFKNNRAISYSEDELE